MIKLEPHLEKKGRLQRTQSKCENPNQCLKTNQEKRAHKG